MPESRDRLSRQQDIIEAYTRRRISMTGERNAGRTSAITFVLQDDDEEGLTAATPFRWGGTPVVGTPQPMRVVPLRRVIGSSGNDRTLLIRGRENLSPLVGSGRGRGRGSVLPSWYPRRPLQDITAVVRAIERRRERQRGWEGQQPEGPTLQDQTVHNSPASTSGARPKDDVSMISPHPTTLNKGCPPSFGKVPKILLNIAHQDDVDSHGLTPQKKLLNKIDEVEKVVMEEINRLKKSPSAKKAERERRVRTLMSMRQNQGYLIHRIIGR